MISPRQYIFIGLDRAHYAWREVMTRLIKEGHFIQSVAITANGNGLIVVNISESGIAEETIKWCEDKLLGPEMCIQSIGYVGHAQVWLEEEQKWVFLKNIKKPE